MAKAGAESLRATVAPEHLCSWQCASRVVDLKFLQKDIGVAWLEPTKSEALRKNSLCKVVTNTITGKSKKSSLTQTPPAHVALKQHVKELRNGGRPTLDPLNVGVCPCTCVAVVPSKPRHKESA